MTGSQKKEVKPQAVSHAPRSDERGTQKSSTDLKATLAGVLKNQPPQAKPASPPHLAEALQKVTGQEQQKKPFEVPEDTLRALFKEQ